MKLYEELAAWWPLLSPPGEYAEEAEFFRRAIEDAHPRARTMLELGSGGGCNAFHLKKRFELTLIDPSAGMLEVSRSFNPECEHGLGDMRDVRLGRTFDAVFIHDAIMYMTTTEDLRKAFRTAYAHLRPDGVALFAPDCVRETYEPYTDHGGRDGEGGRALRYLEWDYDPDESDDTSITHFVLTLREGSRVRIEHDVHTFGVFSRSVWRKLLESEGFDVRVLVDDFARDIFIGRRFAV